MNNPLSSLAEAVRATSAGARLARAWHRFAPSFKVRRRVYGLTMYFDFRDNAVWWTRDAKTLEEADESWEILTRFKGTVWDVGSNVGIFALRAASLGHKVIAFDISKRALELLALSAQANGLSVVTVNRAFSIRSFRYDEPSTSDTENAIRESPAGTGQSIAFMEAAKQFPRPDLLKMDIEGAEMDFIKSNEFKEWIVKGRIPWIVESHSPEFEMMLWTDCKFVRFDGNHFGLNLEGLIGKSTEGA
jgi:FkbM family methyltransferase